MTKSRHEKILEIINKRNVETQEELAGLLNDAGFIVTQATVSRDIKKLNLIKVKTASGRQKYAAPVVHSIHRDDKLVRVLSDAISSMEDAGNILVIKTVPGMAMAAAAALDSLNIPEIIGSIAGDDTIMCAMKDVKHVAIVMEMVKSIIES